MLNERSRLDVASAAMLLLLSLTLAGCGESYKMPPRQPTVARFHVTNHVGGTHYRVLTAEGRCIVAFGNSVQMVDPHSLTVISDVPLGVFGRCGPVVDLALNGERLYAVIEDDAVVELALPPGIAPTVRRSISSDELGILPRHLSVVDGTVYVSGVGGVVDLASGKKLFSTSDECRSVARAGDGLVTCIGRRVNRMSDGGYLGAASELIALPPDAMSGTPATMAFVLRSDENAMAGLMTPDVREVVGGKTVVAMPEAISHVRLFGNQMFIVGPQRIDWYVIKGDSLEYGSTLSILGALDIDRLDPRTFIVVGTAGRAIYQLDEGKYTGQFLVVQREASRLTLATGDGLNTLAGSREGAWMYLVNARAELTKRTIESAPPGPRLASTVDAQAVISPDASTLDVTPVLGSAAGASAKPWQYHEQKGAKLHTVIAVDGDFWVGHDRGITILRADGGQVQIDPKQIEKAKKDPSIVLPVADPVKERMRIPGPVLYLMPLLAGKGASYVSEFGGFGVARFMDEEVDAAATAPAKKK